MRRGTLWVAIIVALGCTQFVSADEPVFSGPQPGETVEPFKMAVVLGGEEGKELDLTTAAGDGPMVLVFVHEMTRPSVALVRLTMAYAARHTKKGLTAGIVFLSDDATAVKEQIKRARHAMPADVPIGISVDGKEGPGAYGLNRNMQLTVLVAAKGKATANFALVQPSVQADGPKIVAALAKAVGDDNPPKIADLADPDGRMAARRPVAEPDIRAWLGPVLRKEADKAAVDKAAAALDAQAEKDEALRRAVGQAARRVVESGKLADYGTPPAQEHLRRWSEKFASDDSPPRPKESGK